MPVANFISFSTDYSNEDTSANGGTTMTMYLHRVGAVSNPKRHTWEPAACALYAVAVGAGVDDSGFTLDTYGGHDQLVYPTFVLSGVPRRGVDVVARSLLPNRRLLARTSWCSASRASCSTRRSRRTAMST